MTDRTTIAEGYGRQIVEMTIPRLVEEAELQEWCDDNCTSRALIMTSTALVTSKTWIANGVPYALTGTVTHVTGWFRDVGDATLFTLRWQ